MGKCGSTRTIITKLTLDPLYELKGAARPAREFYRDPNGQDEVEPVDLLQKYAGRISEHEEGAKLLAAM